MGLTDLSDVSGTDSVHSYAKFRAEPKNEKHIIVLRLCVYTVSPACRVNVTTVV